MAIETTFQRRCLDTEPPTELPFVTASMSIMFILTNIPGNILIILAVFYDPHKNLRTPFNWLLVNLATADLIVGVITQPFSVYYHVKEGLKMSKDPKELKTIHMLYLIPCTASVLSLLSLAIERYLAVRKPKTYHNKVTNRRIFLTIIGIWIVSLSLPNIYFVTGFTAYAFIFANTSIGVVVIFISITYTLMMRKFREMGSNNAKQGTIISSSTVMENKSSADQSLSTVNTNEISTSAISKSRQMMEQKVTNIFLIVLVAFLCCYGPSTFMMYLVNFCDGCSCISLHWFRDFHILFVVLNSSVNFFCYALRSTRFRRVFVKLLRMKNTGDSTDSS